MRLIDPYYSRLRQWHLGKLYEYPKNIAEKVALWLTGTETQQRIFLRYTGYDSFQYLLQYKLFYISLQDILIFIRHPYETVYQLNMRKMFFE